MKRLQDSTKYVREEDLTVSTGCIIPVQNIRNLHLPDEIIESVKKKEFHIYAVNTIDEGIEILTDIPAGKKQADGTYPKGTINYLVMQKLKKYYEKAKMNSAFNTSNNKVQEKNKQKKQRYYMNYSILEEEKRNISKLLNIDYLKKVNFVIDSLDNNILEVEENIENANIYRNIAEYTKTYMYSAMGILKNSLNIYEENLRNIKEYGDKIEFKKEKNKLYILSNVYRLKELFAKSEGRKINN